MQYRVYAGILLSDEEAERSLRGESFLSIVLRGDEFYFASLYVCVRVHVCVCLVSEGSRFGAFRAQNWAPAYHHLKLIEWMQQGQRPAIDVIGASRQVSRAT